MHILPLVSSSAANSTYIYTDTSHILIDAGLSVKKIIELSGRDEFDALFVSHEHGDHVKSAGALGRKLKTPLYMHELTFNKKPDLYKNCTVTFLDPSDVTTIGDLQVKTFSTKHDATYTFGFIIEDLTCNKKLCYLTDTGIITPLMRKRMEEADAFFIEADYDVQMLEDYPGYDILLKERIRSPYGHLSTTDALDGLEKVGADSAPFIIFAHLSSRTNTPEKVLELAKEKFPDYKGQFYVAPMNTAVELC